MVVAGVARAGLDGMVVAPAWVLPQVRCMVVLALRRNRQAWDARSPLLAAADVRPWVQQ